MYIVKNVTSQDISIPELSITLSPGNKVDLDMVSSRYYIDQSRTLKSLLLTNKITCILKDDGRGSFQIKRVSSVKEPQTQQGPSSSDVIDSIKQLEDKITKRIDEKVTNSQANLDVNALNNAIAALQALAGKGGQVAPTKSEDKDTSGELDEKRLLEIQSRTVGRLVGKSESHVKHEEQITDKDIAKNAKELEDLL